MSPQDSLTIGVGDAPDSASAGAAPADERHVAPRDARGMFRSILAPLSDDEEAAEPSEAPAFFRDLNLDQIVASIIAGKQEYNLAPFFHRPLRTVEAVEYRQEVMRDLEEQARFDAINDFQAGCVRFGTMSPRRRSCITNTKSRLGRSTPSNSTARPSSDCFRRSAPRRLVRPVSTVSPRISTPMWRHRPFSNA